MEIKGCENAGACEYFRENTKERLDKHSEVLDDHEKRLIKIETNVETLVKSLDRQTKALWGLASSVLISIISAVISSIIR